MASYNKVVLLGNLTRDVELRHIPSGTAVVDVGIAVNDRVKKGEEWVDEVCFVELTMFGRTAEVAAEYLGKGSQILVEGKLKLEQWEKDGQKHSKHKVKVDAMQMLGKRGEGESPQRTSSGYSQTQSRPQTQQSNQSASSIYGMAADDVPF